MGVVYVKRAFLWDSRGGFIPTSDGIKFSEIVLPTSRFAKAFEKTSSSHLFRFSTVSQPNGSSRNLNYTTTSFIVPQSL